MRKTLCLRPFLFVPVFIATAIFANEDEEVSPLKKPEATAEEKAVETSVAPSVGTKSFDAETVNELFAEYKAENERRAAAQVPHMNFDHLEVIELGPINAQAYEVRNLDVLIDRLDPQPRKRLARLAELDPVAAADIRVTARSEERFFAGENDYGSDMNAGSTANVDFRKVGQSLSSALEKAKKAFREKKATDDQAPVPTEK